MFDGFASQACNQITKAREDPNAFCEYIGDGPGGVPIRQDPTHREWQDVWTKNERSVLLAPIGHGKTINLRNRLLWEIGHNPDIQIVYVSATERHPKKVLASMKAEIERNPRVQHVFPHLRRDPNGKWTSTEIQVARSVRDPDPTVQIFGAFSQSVLGTRADFVVFDDLCNDRNMLTEHGRETMNDWCSSVISRLKPTARVAAIGHIFHEDDQLQRWARIPDWAYHRYEAIVEDENGVSRPLCPSVMGLGSIAKKARELQAIFTEMMLFNRMPSRGVGRFRQVWFDKCLRLGRGLDFQKGWSGATYTGVDLGHRKKAGADITVLFTAAVLPDGRRQVIDIRSGRWKAPEILAEIQDVHRRFGSIIAVENNGAQQFLIDFAHDLDTLPVREHHTGVNKHDLQHGVESLGIELSQQRWVLPCSDNMEPNDEMHAAIKGGLVYDPNEHASDHLMAWWICREAMRKSPAASPAIDIESIDLLMR